MKKAHEKRLSFICPQSDNCYRIINAEGDGIDGVTVDLYGEWILIQFFSEAAEHTARIIAPMCNTVFEGINPSGILLKDRTKSSGADSGNYTSELVAGQYPPEEHTVLHNGIRAQVDLVNAQNTGIFMDMRNVRDRLVDVYHECAGAKILNLFSYTSLFSVHAIVHGMGSAENVDLSNGVLERAKANYKLNNLIPDDRDFIRYDSIAFLKQAVRKKLKYDLVIIDPPTFSRNKNSSFSVQRDMDTLLSYAGEISTRYVISAVNCYKVSLAQYRSFHPESWKNIFVEEQSPDFSGAFSYLKAGLWKIQ